MKQRILTLLAGVALGMALLSGGYAAANTVLTATPSGQTFYIDGQQTAMTAYLIGGSNYVKLRDIGQAVGFNVYWDGAVQIERDKLYTGVGPTTQPNPTDPTEESVLEVLKGLKARYPNNTQSKDKDITVDFVNSTRPGIRILKLDGQTGKPIAGATFLIEEVNGGFTDRRQTDKDGLIVLEGKDGIRPSAYKISEVAAAPNYVLDDTVHVVQLEENRTTTIELTNLVKPTLKILKVDSITKNPVAHAKFQIWRASGDTRTGEYNDLGTFYSNEAGEIVIEHTEPGWFKISELEAPSGYSIKQADYEFYLAAGETKTVQVENIPLSALVVYKYDRVTGEPVEGAIFQVKYLSGTSGTGGTVIGTYRTLKNGSFTVTGFTIDPATQSQTVTIRPDDCQTLAFYNTPVGNFELVKVVEGNESKRIPNVTFEIRRASDGGLVDTITTGSDGRVSLQLDAGNYYAVETECPKEFKLDPTPHYFTMRDGGKGTTLTVTNKAFSGILLHKVDSVTKAGIYGVKFLVYDANKNPIGEYTSDDQGYIYIDNLTVQGKGRLYIRELEAAPGYELDKEYKTVYVQPGKTVEIQWENTPITGQIQIRKYAAEYNEVTGTAAGAPLQGAVYEISEARSGKVVDYITTDARGVAASKPLPLGRYLIKEVTAPAYWQLSGTTFDETLEYSGQIIKLSDYDKPSNLGVTITKRGNAQVLAGSQMRYDFTVANTSNVPLDNYYWHDRIPTDATRATVLTTGTYSARLNYRVLYKTNYRSGYQVLASNLLTTSSYSFSLNAIPMQAGEYVTDVYFDFGRVPVGFQSTTSPTLTVQVLGTVANNYQIINRADVGGKYQGTWQTAQATWLTIVRRLGPVPTLPQTGY